ncbi:MAG: isochorismate synthase [Leptolyngbya sp. SIO4C1]|nr:isochorismate synthase [Leptolyngbya sp. SIO4C1]
MKISGWLNEALKYISEAVARIFGPDDDAYPNTGVQPYEGDPYTNWKDAS